MVLVGDSTGSGPSIPVTLHAHARGSGYARCGYARFGYALRYPKRVTAILIFKESSKGSEEREKERRGTRVPGERGEKARRRADTPEVWYATGR